MNVTIGGTGKTARVDGYVVGGKTGTAQKVPYEEGKYVVSFIGFVPVDDPQFLIYVLVDEPNVEDQGRSSDSSILTKDILDEILPYMNVYQTKDETDEVLPEIDETMVEEGVGDGGFFGEDSEEESSENTGSEEDGNSENVGSSAESDNSAE